MNLGGALFYQDFSSLINSNEIFIDENLLLVLGWDAKQRIR